MCFFEADEPCEVYSITHPACRKPRLCQVCKTPIRRGDVYERHSYVADGSAYSEGMCPPCAIAHRVFREDEHHRGAPTPNWFEQCLVDCYDGAAKGEVKTWRQLHAGIKRRRELARRAEKTGAGR